MNEKVSVLTMYRMAWSLRVRCLGFDSRADRCSSLSERSQVSHNHKHTKPSRSVRSTPRAFVSSGQDCLLVHTSKAGVIPNVLQGTVRGGTTCVIRWRILRGERCELANRKHSLRKIIPRKLFAGGGRRWHGDRGYICVDQPQAHLIAPRYILDLGIVPGRGAWAKVA